MVPEAQRGRHTQTIAKDTYQIWTRHVSYEVMYDKLRTCMRYWCIQPARATTETASAAHKLRARQ